MIDPLGDGISQVTLIDKMGDDLRVVDAARVSFNKQSEWEEAHDYDPKTGRPIYSEYYLGDKDVRLINYLARHNHWTPFSHVMFTFRIKMPIFVARQWYKHQVGFTRNEVSRRYVDSPPEFFVPSEWRSRAEDKKQGSGEALFSANGGQSFFYQHFLDSATELYDQLIKVGVCPEQARMVLPQSMYTEFYETGSLAGYARLCGLRDQSDTQLETQKYAQAISSIIQDHVPVSWEALTK